MDSLAPQTITRYGCHVNEASQYFVVDSKTNKPIPVGNGWKVERWADRLNMPSWGMTDPTLYKSRMAALKGCDRWMNQVKKLVSCQGVCRSDMDGENQGYLWAYYKGWYWDECA